MFIQKVFFFFSGQIRRFYCRVEKASQKVCGGKLKLDQFFLGVRGEGSLPLCNFVWEN